MNAILKVAALSLIGLLSHYPTDAGDRTALVIGVDKYEHLPKERQLKVAVQDAETIAETLRYLPSPFKVSLLTNPTREEVSTTLESFVQDSDDAECALVYFAGHGIEFHGENYLLMRDTDVLTIRDDIQRMKEKLYYEALPLQKIIFDLEDTASHLKLVILDACRDNPLEAATTGGTRSLVGNTTGLGRVSAPGGMLISYSADAGQQANDGLFTEILARNMRIPGSPILNVFATTREEVRARALELQNAGKGLLHEPAEYTKLGSEALSFSFSPLPATNSGPVHTRIPSANPGPAAVSPLPSASRPSSLALFVIAGVAIVMAAILFFQYRHFSRRLRTESSGAISEGVPNAIPSENLRKQTVTEEFQAPPEPAPPIPEPKVPTEHKVSREKEVTVPVAPNSPPLPRNILPILVLTLLNGSLALASGFLFFQCFSGTESSIGRILLFLSLATLPLVSLLTAYRLPSTQRLFVLKLTLRGILLMVGATGLYLASTSLGLDSGTSVFSVGTMEIPSGSESAAFVILGVAWLVLAVTYSNFLFDYSKSLRIPKTR